MRITVLFSLAMLLVLSACQNTPSKYIINQGTVYGTYYRIKYESPTGKDFNEDVSGELQRLTNIFSHYEPNSTISKINKNIDTELEPEFITCFNKAIEVSEITKGAFDITAADLINAWGFGPEDRKKMTPEIIDSLKQLTGYKKVKLENGKIIKENPYIQLNMSAIAKGYTCDLVGKFLEKKGCMNYMVDIGGEVVAKGKNDKGKIWTIGIREPIENPFKEDLSAILQLPDRAMATSGNYLNFYEENGKKYAHTIDPISGYPVQHSILSSTVVAHDCMTADAFATSFMVVGKDMGIEIARQIPGLEIYFIYADEDGKNQIYRSEGFEELLKK